MEKDGVLVKKGDKEVTGSLRTIQGKIKIEIKD
jgi:hypothetical protein